MRIDVHRDEYTATPYQRVSILGSESPRTFTQGSAWERIEQAEAGNDACETFYSLRIWGGFGDAVKPVSTNKSIRLSVPFLSGQPTHGTTCPLGIPCANRHHACTTPFLLGRYSYMRFDTRALRTLPPSSSFDTPCGETLVHLGNRVFKLVHAKTLPHISCVIQDIPVSPSQKILSLFKRR